jgi:hypothetical protein
MAGLRAFVAGDVSAVSDLVWKVLHERQGPSPASLKTYFEELFLQNPWQDEGIVSRVYEDGEGKVRGFFGAVPRRMTLQGKPVRMAFGSNFVLDPECRASMAAMQLVRTFMKGTQDVSITDSANENSRQMLRSLGFTVVPVYSLLWARPLRPSLYGVHGVTRLKKSKLMATLGAVAKPVCGLADGAAARFPGSPFRQVRPTATTGEELSVETLLQCLQSMPSKQLLLPEYDLHSLDWVLQFVTKRKALGEVRRVLVRDKDKKAIGWFIYYVAPGAVGEVLQIGSDSPSVGKVLDHLFYDAWEQGLAGLHGRLEPQFMQELTQRSCFFLRNGSWTLVHSSKPEFLGPIQSGAAFFSRLDGEWPFRVDANRLVHES